MSWISIAGPLGFVLIAVIGLSTLVTSTRAAQASVRVVRRGDRAWPTLPIAVPAGGPFRSPIPTLTEFEAVGLGHIASLDVHLPDHSAIFAVLLSHDGTTFGAVTPVHVTLLSEYEGKLFTTTNRFAHRSSPYQLQQAVDGGSVEQLFAAHRRGLQAISAHGRLPTRYEPSSAVETFLAIDDASTRRARTSSPLPHILAGFRLLPRHAGSVDGAGSDARIRRWLDSPESWRSV